VENKLVVTVIATGFEEKRHQDNGQKKAGKKKVVFDLEDQQKPPQFSHTQKQRQSEEEGEMQLKQKDEDRENADQEEQEEQEVANQITFPFEDSDDNSNQQGEDMKLYTKEEQSDSGQGEKKPPTDPWKVEKDKTAEEGNEPREPQQGDEDPDNRRNRLRGLSMKMNKDKRNIEEMEREPAFKRKNVALKNEESSDDENMSRYTLDEETKLRRNNPYLHDRAD
jgi:cell division protein FtsZ